MAHAPKRIGLVHHMSGGNLGDDATLAAVKHNIETRWPDAEIVGFAMVYEDAGRAMTFPFSHKSRNDAPAKLESKATLKVKIKTAVTKNRFLYRLLKTIYTVAIAAPKAFLQEIPFLVKSFRDLRSFDLLIINAGGQLAESSGRPRAFDNCSWKFPYTMFKWVLLARLARVKPIVLNLGAGPLAGPLSKRFFRSALSRADYVAFRDEQSSAFAHQMGFTGATHVFPDSAYSRDVSALRASRVGRKDSVVGLAPMVFGEPSPPLKNEDPLYTSFLQQTGLFASWLVRNDYCPTLFCSDMEVDPSSLCGVTAVVRTDLGTAIRDGSLGRVHQWSTEELLANMSSMDYVVTTRFHGVVFAHMLNIPVLAISNHPTVSKLMNDLGLSEYCVDIDKCDSSVLVDTFVSLVSNRDEIKNRMAEKLASYKEKLSNQFDQLFPSEVSTVDRDETVIR